MVVLVGRWGIFEHGKVFWVRAINQCANGLFDPSVPLHLESSVPSINSSSPTFFPTLLLTYMDSACFECQYIALQLFLVMFWVDCCGVADVVKIPVTNRCQGCYIPQFQIHTSNRIPKTIVFHIFIFPNLSVCLYWFSLACFLAMICSWVRKTG